jgi:hypothetical protein
MVTWPVRAAYPFRGSRQQPAQHWRKPTGWEQLPSEPNNVHQITRIALLHPNRKGNGLRRLLNHQRKTKRKCPQLPEQAEYILKTLRYLWTWLGNALLKFMNWPECKPIVDWIFGNRSLIFAIYSQWLALLLAIRLFSICSSTATKRRNTRTGMSRVIICPNEDDVVPSQSII